MPVERGDENEHMQEVGLVWLLFNHIVYPAWLNTKFPRSYFLQVKCLNLEIERKPRALHLLRLRMIVVRD